METKTCSRCRNTYSLTTEFFYLAKQGWLPRCKTCTKEIARARGHGLTTGAVNRQRRKQGWKCAICGTPEAELLVPLSIDHDHSTGAFRGMLCPRCNNLLGMARDDPAVLQAAIEYLLVHKVLESF